MAPAQVRSSIPIVESSATELCQRLRLGELTSLEVLEAFIAKVEAEPLVNAVVVKDYARARQRAARADECWRDSHGQSLWGRLHGLPMTVKEEVEVEGLCSKQTDGEAVEDPVSCLAVQRLLDEGAIIFGKTNTPRRCRDWQTYNATFGPTVNPHDAQRSSGGSSGGSCVAVAVGHSCVELGADVAGSIRVPACFCGVFGLQGTYGRIPTGLSLPLEDDGDSEGPKPLKVPKIDSTVLPHGLKVLGPICKAPEDLALMTAVLERLPLVRTSDSDPLFRIAILSEIGGDGIEPPLSKSVREALERVRTQLQEAGESRAKSRIAVAALRKLFPENFSAVSYNLYHQLLADRVADPAAMVSRHWCRMVWDAFFDANGVDVPQLQLADAKLLCYVLSPNAMAVLMPISPTLPFLRNEILGADAYMPKRKVWVNDESEPQQRCYADYFYWPHFSILAQLPSVSVPCGFLELPQVPSSSPAWCTAMDHPAGFVGDPKVCKVPVGFQLVGRPHSDAQLVDMAAEISRISAG